jgi:urease accessory protein
VAAHGVNVAALLLSDARTPTGSYAQSGGLEPAIADGLPVGAVPDFIRGRLHTLALTEATLACAAARNAADGDLEALLRLDGEALARCPSQQLRAASAALGRSILRTGAQVFAADAELITAYRAASASTPRPVAFGVVAAAARLDPIEVAIVALYDDAATVAAAAVKLLALDSGTATGWVAAAAAEIHALARRAAAAAAAGDLLAYSAPMIEQRSLSHASDQRRLFAT